MRRCRHPNYVAFLSFAGVRVVYWCPECGAIRRPSDDRWTYPKRHYEKNPALKEKRP